MTDDVTSSFTHKCFGCGGTATVRNGKPRSHLCRWRWYRRRLFRAYLEGWHSAHRWAVENPDDEMVLADAHDYGSGWAGYMRQGPDGGSFRVAL